MSNAQSQWISDCLAEAAGRPTSVEGAALSVNELRLECERLERLCERLMVLLAARHRPVRVGDVWRSLGGSEFTVTSVGREYADFDDEEGAMALNDEGQPLFPDYWDFVSEGP